MAWEAYHTRGLKVKTTDGYKWQAQPVIVVMAGAQVKNRVDWRGRLPCVPSMDSLFPRRITTMHGQLQAEAQHHSYRALRSNNLLLHTTNRHTLQPTSHNAA